MRYVDNRLLSVFHQSFLFTMQQTILKGANRPIVGQPCNRRAVSVRAQAVTSHPKLNTTRSDAVSRQPLSSRFSPIQKVM